MGRIYKPYILSEFNCTGNETDILDCPHLNRDEIGKCAAKHAAGVFCFKDDPAGNNGCTAVFGVIFAHLLCLDLAGLGLKITF